MTALPVAAKLLEDPPDSLDWARRLRRREHLQDRTLSILQKAMWREALKRELEAEKREPA